MKPTIVCHSFPAWDSPYVKSTLELLKELAKTHRVIMIDYHYTFKDLLDSPFAPRQAIIKRKKRVMKVTGGNIEVISTLPILPINWIKQPKVFDWFAKVNAWWIQQSLIKRFENPSLKEYILINAFNPIYGYHLRNFFKPIKKIYYCYDEISATSWSGVHGGKYEKLLIPTMDAVVCTSRQLLSKKRTLANRAFLVQNGVNLEIFMNETVEKQSKPILGYVGAVDDRIDFDLVRSVALYFPHHHLEFYGDLKTKPPILPENVHFYGAVKQHLLPEKINEMEVCLVPFVSSKLTAAIYPLKVNEYLAMGKPVVSTSFADLSDFEKHMYVADTTELFIHQIQKAMKYNSRVKIQERKEFAAQNSWSHRADALRLILSKIKPSMGNWST